MTATHAVGIDLGTTYSTIAYLNEHGEPITLPNGDGELSTPSVVLWDGDEAIVGTEALRSAVLHPKNVVQYAKRFMGDPQKRWNIEGRPVTPIDVSALILKHLLAAGREQIGNIEHAVITVPAQFGEAQRLATIEAGHRAGLNRVDIINEPVAAALCHVLGTEGLWFTELAEDQRILVFDLGGGTLDLSLVRYAQNEVAVIGSDGDLNLGGLDWNATLIDAIASQFQKEFRLNPRVDPESLQFLSNEVEQTKRSLSNREKAALTCQHAGHRKTYQIEREKFEKLSRPLVDRCEKVTRRLLKTLEMGWAHVDVVLTTGGASRMPMIRERLKKMSGQTLNTTLSPDLSIAHGATYYAGMLLSNDKFARSILSAQASGRLAQVRQSSVNARPLGILARVGEEDRLEPHFLIPANTPLPAEAKKLYGTVAPNQRRVRLRIVEGSLGSDPPAVRLGDCIIDDLPPDLPEGSQVEVTIRYDEQAKVHVRAREVASGREATVEILRHENLKNQLTSDQVSGAAVVADNNTSGPPRVSKRTARSKSQDPADPGEEEFWRTV